eukprot:gene28750-31931_t
MSSADTAKPSGGLIGTLLKAITRILVIVLGCYLAYNIRIIAIEAYGPLIHEFDPWFNYRAAEYLHANGQAKFFSWFDHMSWYPLGRPVGTTIYPGIQFTAVGLYHALAYLGMPMELVEVCCYIPAWFGVIASIFTGLLTYEVSGSSTSGAFATLIMAVIPAHTMRSIGGGFDNEAVAVPALCATFYLWCRSLRTGSSWLLSPLVGLSYFYMVAGWGGYVFVLNMIAAHTILLLLMGRYSSKLYLSYTIFFTIGTLLGIQVPVVGFTPFKSMEQVSAEQGGCRAEWVQGKWVQGRYSTKLYLSYTIFFTIGTLLGIQVPVVGFTPFKSMEQIIPLGLFFMLQFLMVNESNIKGMKLTPGEANAHRLKMMGLAAAVGVAILAVLSPTGLLGPVSMRVRSLFVPHTRTGNPLVDSVAEHQATSPDAYWKNLHYACLFAPVGLVMLWRAGRQGDAKWFGILYAVIAYYFSGKMNRLIILLGPIASALTGICIGCMAEWCMATILSFAFSKDSTTDDSTAPAAATTKPAEAPSKKTKKMSKAIAKSNASIKDMLYGMVEPIVELLPKQHFPLAKFIIAVVLCLTVPGMGQSFYKWSNEYAYAMSMSQPQVVSMGTLANGQLVTITDYLDSYEWLKTKTPEDARVLAWWDYGYQITGIGNRTSLADGNTWNQAHIALLGKMLTSPEQKAHRLIRHLADYVLVWSGGGHDDLSKSGHLARIGASYFPDHCDGSPGCQNFGFMDENQMNPTPMMADSLLYKMTSTGVKPGVSLDSTLWELVRIYKVKSISEKSRAWLADPANKLCDRPGSWYCPGQYPPAIWSALPDYFLKGHRLPQAAEFPLVMEDHGADQRDDILAEPDLARFFTEIGNENEPLLSLAERTQIIFEKTDPEALIR